MTWFQLLTVEDTFCLRRDQRESPFILIVHPNLSVPENGWKERNERIKVLRPDGSEFEAPAQISLSHFNIPDPNVSIDQRWRVTISFPNLSKEQVPVGSRLLVSEELRDSLLTQSK